MYLPPVPLPRDTTFDYPKAGIALGEQVDSDLRQRRIDQALERNDGSFENAVADLLRGGRTEDARVVAQMGFDLRKQGREELIAQADIRTTALDEAARAMRNTIDRDAAGKAYDDVLKLYEPTREDVGGLDPGRLSIASCITTSRPLLLHP